VIVREATHQSSSAQCSRLRPRQQLLVLLGYLLIWGAFFGRPLTQRASYVGGNGPDPKLFIWSMEWWSHAVFHPLLNPLSTKALWAPSGYNLAWATSIPLLGLGSAGLTAFAGPLISYNAWMILGPALNGYTCFLLCYSITGRRWASTAGGLTFMSSSYMLSHTRGGHLNLLCVFLVPLVCRVFVRFSRSEVSRSSLIWRLTALLVAQFLISEEILATLVVVGAITGIITYSHRDRRQSVRCYATLAVSSLIISTAIVAPILLQMFLGSHPYQSLPSVAGSTDLVNLVVPTSLTFLGGRALRPLSITFSGASLADQAAYLGLPLLLAIALFARRTWRSHDGGLLLAIFGASVILSFGAQLHVLGTPTVPLPWALLRYLPLMGKVLPIRMMVYAALAASVIMALWLADGRPSWRRWCLLGLCLVSLAPNPAMWNWRTDVTAPAFFSEAGQEVNMADRRLIVFGPGTAGLPMVWQAQDHLSFTMAGGYTGGIPLMLAHEDIAHVLALQQCPSPSQFDQLLHYARRSGVDALVSYFTSDGATCPLPSVANAVTVSRRGGVVVVTP
jgi:hypothetical protein